MRAKKILYSFLLILFKTNFLQCIFSVFGVDFDVFSAFLICIKKSLLSSGAIPQPLSEAVQGGEDQAREESWLFPY
ncbi:MAG: hypothetical protein ACLVC5_08680 [Clostridia bacterium]